MVLQQILASNVSGAHFAHAAATSAVLATLVGFLSPVASLIATSLVIFWYCMVIPETPRFQKLSARVKAFWKRLRG